MASLGHNELTYSSPQESCTLLKFCHGLLLISQTSFSNAFSVMKMFKFQLKFHWRLFPRVQLPKLQHWFRYWLGAVQATSHYLNQWWSRLVMHKCVTQSQWGKNIWACFMGCSVYALQTCDNMSELGQNQHGAGSGLVLALYDMFVGKMGRKCNDVLQYRKRYQRCPPPPPPPLVS